MTALMHDAHAEAAILSACLQERSGAATARALVTPDDLSAPRHRVLYAAILDVDGRGEAVDPITLAAMLGARGELEAVGGKDYLYGLIDVVPHARHLREHCGIVRGHADRRRLVATLADAQRAIESGADAPLAEIAGTVQAALSGVVTAGGRRGYQVVTGDEVIALADSLSARRETLRAGRVVGIATGYPEIDDVLCGVRPSELAIFAARPKGYKTALVLNMAVNAIVDQREHVGFVSTEMTRDELLERAGNRLAQLTTGQTAAGRVTDQEIGRFATRLHELSGHLHIDDEAFPTLDDVIARAIDLKARHPEISLLVVDYLQRITKRLAGRRGDEEIALVTQGIKSLAKATKCAIYAPAQVNYKETDKRDGREPTSADIQGGSGFAQDANFLFLLHRPGLFNPSPDLQRVLQVKLAESRRTDRFTALLDCHGEFMTIDSAGRRAMQRRRIA